MKLPGRTLRRCFASVVLPEQDAPLSPDFHRFYGYGNTNGRGKVFESGRGCTLMDAIPIAVLLSYRPNADKDNTLLQIWPHSSRV